MKYFDVIAAGFGGQGILQLGRVLATGGMLDGRQVTCIPAYGAEMRGGTANCTVIISSEEIGSPLVSHPHALIAMNQPSFARFSSRILPGGVILVNTSLVELGHASSQTKYLGVAATEIAEELGCAKAANMVALGAFVAETGIFPLDTAKEALSRAFAGKGGLIKKNIQALELGAAHFEVLKGGA